MTTPLSCPLPISSSITTISSFSSTPIRLLTLNSCLFPPGLRQSVKSTQKTLRLKSLIQLICGKLSDPFLEKKELEYRKEYGMKKQQKVEEQTTNGKTNGNQHSDEANGRAPLQPSLHSPSSPQVAPFSSSSSSQRYDIVCLQEVFSSFYSSYYREALVQHPLIRRLFPFIAVCPSIGYRDGFLFDGGLLIFSRWPIEEKKFVPFDFNPEWMQYVQKGFLYAKIQIPISNDHLSSPSSLPSSTSIHLITTHFHPEEAAICCSRHRPSHVRKIQAAQICTFLSKLSVKMEEKVVLVGDINVDKESIDGEEMKRILKMEKVSCDFEDGGEEMYDSWQQDSQLGKGAVCTVHHHFDFAFHAEMVCADYAMGRNVKFVNVHRVRQYVSDHYPVAIDIQL